MELGRLYHMLEQHKKAADNFAHVLPAMEHPERFDFGKAEKTFLGKAAATYDLIGESLLLAGRLPEATAAFEKGDAKAPNPGLLQYNLARVSARAGKPEEALARLEKAFQLRWTSEGDGPYELLAEVLKKLGKERELLPRLEKLHAARPADVPLGYFLAGQYRRAEQLDKAEALYSTLLKKTPASEGYQALVELYRKAKRTDALLEVLGAEAARSGRLESLGSEGKTISEDAALMRQVVEAARQRLRKGPDKLDYGMRAGRGVVGPGGQAVRHRRGVFRPGHRRPAQAGRRIAAGLGRGAALGRSGGGGGQGVPTRNRPEGVAAGQPGVLLLSGRRLGDVRSHRRCLGRRQEGRRDQKNSPLYCSRVPWILQRAKRYDEAIAAYAQLIARFDADYDSADTREIVRDARLSLSALCVEKKRIAEAEEWLQQVLDEFPDDIGGLQRPGLPLGR